MSTINFTDDNTSQTFLDPSPVAGEITHPPANGATSASPALSVKGQSTTEEDASASEGSRRSEVLSTQQKAIWIASYPKSGNTWVRVFIHNLMRELRGEAGDPQSINALNQMTSREGLARSFEQRLGKPIHGATSAEIAAVRPLVQADQVREFGAPVFIKTHNIVANVEAHPTINFEITLAAVHVVRNPLDIAVSYAHHSDLSIDQIIEHMAEPSAYTPGTERRVYEFMSSWSFHVASWMSVPYRPVLTLRYEDMLTAPERTFARLAAFLRMKPALKQLRSVIEKSSFSELARQEAAHGFIERPKTAEIFFRSGTAGQWKQVLSKSQVRSIVQAHGPMMMRFGYLKEDCGG